MNKLLLAFGLVSHCQARFLPSLTRGLRPQASLSPLQHALRRTALAPLPVEYLNRALFLNTSACVLPLRHITIYQRQSKRQIYSFAHFNPALSEDGNTKDSGPNGRDNFDLFLSFPNFWNLPLFHRSYYLPPCCPCVHSDREIWSQT